MSTRRFFYCYSARLCKYLKSRGIMYNCRGLHMTTKALFYQFDYSEELQNALNTYKYDVPDVWPLAGKED